jgi:hypothetical protein
MRCSPARQANYAAAAPGLACRLRGLCSILLSPSSIDLAACDLHRSDAGSRAETWAYAHLGRSAGAGQRRRRWPWTLALCRRAQGECGGAAERRAVLASAADAAGRPASPPGRHADLPPSLSVGGARAAACCAARPAGGAGAAAGAGGAAAARREQRGQQRFQRRRAALPAPCWRHPGWGRRCRGFRPRRVAAGCGGRQP